MMKRLGWVGFTDDKPYFENVLDTYVQPDEKSVSVVDVYKSKKQARRRFQDVREVFVKSN